MEKVFVIFCGLWSIVAVVVIAIWFMPACPYSMRFGKGSLFLALWLLWLLLFFVLFLLFLYYFRYW